MSATTDVAIHAIRAALDGYVFRVRDEAELQDQVCAALRSRQIERRREVRDLGGGRFDILCDEGVVLELKLRASAASVERQAQRYAMLSEVTAVCVVTTSSRLAIELAAGGAQIGGKPFAVIAVRTS